VVGQVHLWKLRGVVISHLFENTCTAFPSTLVSKLELSLPLPVLLLLHVGGLSRLNTRDLLVDGLACTAFNTYSSFCTKHLPMCWQYKCTCFPQTIVHHCKHIFWVTSDLDSDMVFLHCSSDICVTKASYSYNIISAYSTSVNHAYSFCCYLSFAVRSNINHKQLQYWGPPMVSYYEGSTRQTYKKQDWTFEMWWIRQVFVYIF
jgi:hypothetical protein